MKIFKHFFKIIIKPIISLWNIYGGILLSVFIGWLTDYSKNSMDTITSFIIMSLSCVGALTFIKVMVFKKKPNKVDSVVTQQMSIKTIKTAIDPVKSGEDLGKTIITTTTILERLGKKVMEKIKNFFKRVWGNKFTILSIFVNLIVVGVADFLVFSEYLLRFNFFVENQLAFKIAVPILSVIYLALDIFTTITKYGWENLNELKEKSAQKAIEKASKLSKEQKEVIKTQLSSVKNALNSLEAELAQANEIIKNFEVLKSLGGIINITQDKANLYSQAVSKKPTLEAQISDLKLQLAQLQQALK